MAEHTTISIRRELHEEIQDFLAEEQEHGYSGISEFTKEAIRVHLEQVVRPNIQLIVRNRLKRNIYRRRFEKLFRE